MILEKVKNQPPRETIKGETWGPLPEDLLENVTVLNARVLTPDSPTSSPGKQPQGWVVLIRTAEKDDPVLLAIKAATGALLREGKFSIDTFRGDGDSFRRNSLAGEEAESIKEPLSRRESQILTYVANGHSNKQIAYALTISQQTVKNHLSSILRKLNANDRAHAVALALRHGRITM